MEQDRSLPEFGQPLPAVRPSPETLNLLWHRRSTAAKTMTGPGPSRDEIGRMLTIAARAPDHRRVVPYRFIVIGEDARDALGDLLARAAEARGADGDIPDPETARRLAYRAPSIVAVVAATDPDHKTPEWEQILSVGAVCQNLLIAAVASGWAVQWLTEWWAYDTSVRSGLGLADAERIAGYIHLGTAAEDPLERPRPDASALTTDWPTTE